MKLKAKSWIERKHVAGNLYRNIIHIEVNGYKITGFGIHAPEHNQTNSNEQLDLAEAIVNKLNEGQDEEPGEPKLFIKTLTTQP